MTKMRPDVRAGGKAVVGDAPPSTMGRILFDPRWCRTCRVCEVMCSIAHEGVASRALSRINVTFDEFRDVDAVSGRVCLQCQDAPCMEACPVAAMYRDARTGAVVIDRERCVGCMKCRSVCPWSVPKLYRLLKVAIKCDLCADREGGPVCVRMCPLSGKALRYEPRTGACGASDRGAAA